MHELGLLSAMVGTIKVIAEKEKIEKIEKVILQVGELSGVLPDYLKSCYPAAVYKTFMENTELELEIVEGIAKCIDCNEEFSALRYDLECPNCGSVSLVPLSGREFIIKEIICY